jgi:glycosyltransferase involved in cell wall biosynthesis
VDTTEPVPREDVAVVIPALDCETTIGTAIRGAKRFVEHVLVVDDGSRDRTAAAAAAAGAEVVRHERNLGKGAALQRGMRALLEKGVQRAVAMDGDGQHLPEEIPALLAVSDAEPEALVIGARKVAAGAVTPMRGFGNRFANRWVQIACGLDLPDTQSGLRVYPLRTTASLGCRAGHFAFETEVLIRAARNGVAVRSVPVEAYYPPIAERRSHFRPVVDTVRIIFTVLGLILRLR